MSIDRSKLRWNGWGRRDRPDNVFAREEVWSWLARELGMPSLLLTPALSLEEITLPESHLTDQDRRVLAHVVGADSLRTDKYERAFHARGRSYCDLIRLRAGDLSDAPDAVVYPTSNEQVLMLLAYAAERNIAVVPYGGGTSEVGGVTPRQQGHAGAITIDLSCMDLVTSVDATSLSASAQAGIDGLALERSLAARGLTLGHFPQSFEFSTLGGWIAHGGAGQQSNRYGRVEDWLIAAEVATPRGMLRERPFPGSGAGPRLADLIVGSEGTFGVVVSATARVHWMPETAAARTWAFPDFESGAAAIREAVQTGVPAAMLRLSDAEETRVHRAFSGLAARPSLADRASSAVLDWRYTNPCVLISEFEGSRRSVLLAKASFARIARSHAALPLGRRPAEEWQRSRFAAPYRRDPMLDRGLGVETIESATTWSNLQRLYEAVKLVLETAIGQTSPRVDARGLVLCHTGHSHPGGASLQFTCIFPRSLENEVAQWQAIKHAASQAIVTNGGTITHPHGAGEDHLPWMSQEKGRLGIEVRRAIKRTLDPKGILNPGKLIP